jgi:hypothetical protein
MKTVRRMALLICIATLVSTFGFPVQASVSDKLTIFSFSQPVEIPGGKVLPAGTYAFKVLDNVGNRNIVQIFDKDRTKLYATVLTIADYRPNPTDKPVIKFSETKAGAPVAIKEWFYPGDDYGQEFVYPKKRAVELAKASHQSVPSMSDKMASNINQPATTSPQTQPSVQALKDTEVKAEEPGGEEVEVAEVFIIHPTAVPFTNAAVVMTDAGESKDLPKTASQFPLLFTAGLLLLMTGVSLWLVSKRTM